jgi:MFS family permease
MLISLVLKELEAARSRHRGSFFSFGNLRDLDPLFRTTFLILIFGTFCMMMRGTVFNSMVPLYAGRELGYSATQVGGLFGLVGLINVLMIAPSGYLSDKIGRKAATVPAATLVGLSFVVFGIATSLPLLTVAAALHGLGSGFALGSMSTSTFDISPEGSIARFQSLRRFAAELGSISGPPFAGVIASVLEARAVFLVFAPLFLISASLLAFVAKETHPDKRQRAATKSVEAPSGTV